MTEQAGMALITLGSLVVIGVVFAADLVESRPKKRRKK